VDDFDAIEGFVEASKQPSSSVSIGLCEGSNIKFERVTDMTGAKFDMACEGGVCEFDGQGKTHFFQAGEDVFVGPHSTHIATFDGINFVNGWNGNVRMSLSLQSSLFAISSSHLVFPCNNSHLVEQWIFVGERRK